MAEQLKGVTVALLATTGFEQAGLTIPRDALQEAGATTHLISPDSKPVRAWNVDGWGAAFDVDVSLKQADPNDYEALLLPGGVLNQDKLRMQEDAVAFAKSFFGIGKPVASICHGAQTLIEAEVVEGRDMTSSKSIQADLRNAGAHVIDEEVVTDGNLVTSRKPDDSAFNEAMITLFSTAKREAGSQ